MKNLKKFIRVLFAMIIAITLGGHAQPVEAADPASIEIWEGYGGGGNSKSIFKNDYVVLKNKTDKQQSLDGLFLHQGSLTNWANKYPLEGKIEPNGYFLIKGSAGNGGERELPVGENLELDKLNLGGKSFRVAITTNENKPDANNTMDTLVTEGRTLNNYESYLKYPENNSNILDHRANPEKVLEYITSQPAGNVDPDVKIVEISYNPEGGEFDTEPIESVEAGKLFELPIPTREGYTFKGYAIENGELFKEDGTKVETYEFMPSGKYYINEFIELSALWEEEKDPTVTIDPNGGSMNEGKSSKVVKVGTMFNFEFIGTYQFFKDGYQFDGLKVIEGSILDESGNPVTEFTKGQVRPYENYKPQGDVVLQAQWIPYQSGQIKLNIKRDDGEKFVGGKYQVVIVNQDTLETKILPNTINHEVNSVNGSFMQMGNGNYTIKVAGLDENEFIKEFSFVTPQYGKPEGDTTTNLVDEKTATLDVKFDSSKISAALEYNLIIGEKEPEIKNVNVTYKSNKKVTDLVLPESQEVEAGSTIKLPEIAPVMKAGVALDKFEYYLVNGEQKQPGDEIVVNEDTEIVAYYQSYNYRYTANIYLADENGMPGTKLKDASGFVVKANDIESVPSKNYPANLTVGPLLPGTYNITAVVPEGYELVNILDYHNNPVTSETRPVGAESTTNSRVLKVVVREKAPEVQKPEGLYIYELYGGGGRHNTYYKNSYIVLENKSANPIDLNGKYLHLTDKWSNEFVNNVALDGTIPAGGYYVLQGGTFSFETSSLGKELPQVNQVIGDVIPERDFAVAITMTEEAPEAPYSYDDPNIIDFVGTTRKNKMYMGQPASSPRDTWSARRVAYTGNNGTDFTFAFKANPNSKVDHEKYAKGEEDHREPLWYLNETNEEKVTVTFAHASDAEDFALENNEVPAEQKVWSETTIKLPAVKEEEKYNFLGWDVDGDGTADKQAEEEFEVTEDVTITGRWEEVKAAVNPDMIGEVTLQLKDLTGLRAFDSVQRYKSVIKLVNNETGEEYLATSDSKERYGIPEYNFFPVPSGEYKVVFGDYDLTLANFKAKPSSFTKMVDKSALSEDGKTININIEFDKDSSQRSNHVHYYAEIVDAKENEPEVQKATVTYLFNKDIAGVGIPEAQEVEVGSTITLPEINPEVSGEYSFLGWAISDNKYATPKLKPGDEVTVTEDMTIMAIWEGAYGKVTLTFHENEFIDDKYENRDKITKIEDLEGFGFTVTNQQSGKVTAGKKSSSKGQVAISNGLVKGTYALDVTVPEGYEIVRIVRNAGGKNPNVVIENGGTITLPRPEVPFNLTMVDSIYVEVKKVEPEVKKATVTYLFNKDIAGVVIPEAQEVEVGSTITLPEVSPEVSGEYSFLGWAIGNNKYATPKLKPGDEVTVTEDMTIMAIWEGAYGKVTLTFHENEFIDDKYENRDKITKIEDLEGFGFTVTNQQSGEVTTGKKSSSKGQISISNGLVKGTYTLDVTVPEDYEIVRIVRNAGGKNPNVVIENGGTITLPRPEVPFNLTMVDSIYVEVKKVEPEVKKATVTFKFNKAVNGVELPESITVPVDTEIELPNIENKYVGDLSFIGWKVKEDSIPRADHNPGEKITVTKDMTVTGVWDYNNGRVDAIFHEGTYTGTYPKNQINMTRVENLDGFSMNVVHSELDKTTQAAPISTKGTLEASKLEPGHYTLNVSVPEGYEIVRIVRAKAADNYDLSGVETVENGSIFSFPPKETPFNMSMVESFYVEVRKVEQPKADLTVTYDFSPADLVKSNARVSANEKLGLPKEALTVKEGEEITLVRPLAKVRNSEGESYIFKGFAVNGDEENLLKANAKLTVNENTTITAVYEAIEVEQPAPQPEVKEFAVEYKFQKIQTHDEITDLQNNTVKADEKVKEGTKVILPEVKFEDRYEFVGYEVNGDTRYRKNPGEEVEITEDTTIVGVWKTKAGMVRAYFTEEYAGKKLPVENLIDGFGFSVTNTVTGTTLTAEQVNDYFQTPNFTNGGGLGTGNYVINVTVPEGYTIENIYGHNSYDELENLPVYVNGKATDLTFAKQSGTKTFVVVVKKDEETQPEVKADRVLTADVLVRDNKGYELKVQNTKGYELTIKNDKGEYVLKTDATKANRLIKEELPADIFELDEVKLPAGYELVEYRDEFNKVITNVNLGQYTKKTNIKVIVKKSEQQPAPQPEVKEFTINYNYSPDGIARDNRRINLPLAELKVKESDKHTLADPIQKVVANGKEYYFQGFAVNGDQANLKAARTSITVNANTTITAVYKEVVREEQPAPAPKAEEITINLSGYALGNKVIRVNTNAEDFKVVVKINSGEEVEYEAVKDGDDYKVELKDALAYEDILAVYVKTAEEKSQTIRVRVR